MRTNDFQIKWNNKITKSTLKLQFYFVTALRQGWENNMFRLKIPACSPKTQLAMSHLPVTDIRFCRSKHIHIKILISLKTSSGFTLTNVGTQTRAATSSPVTPPSSTSTSWYDSQVINIKIWNVFKKCYVAFLACANVKVCVVCRSVNCRWFCPGDWLRIAFWLTDIKWY